MAAYTVGHLFLWILQQVDQQQTGADNQHKPDIIVYVSTLDALGPLLYLKERSCLDTGAATPSSSVVFKGDNVPPVYLVVTHADRTVERAASKQYQYIKDLVRHGQLPSNREAQRMLLNTDALPVLPFPVRDLTEEQLLQLKGVERDRSPILPKDHPLFEVVQDRVSRAGFQLAAIANLKEITTAKNLKWRYYECGTDVFCETTMNALSRGLTREKYLMAKAEEATSKKDKMEYFLYKKQQNREVQEFDSLSPFLKQVKLYCAQTGESEDDTLFLLKSEVRAEVVDDMKVNCRDVRPSFNGEVSP